MPAASPTPADTAGLRRTVLAAAMLDDLNVAVDPAAGPEQALVVPVTGARPARLGWPDVAAAVGPAPPDPLAPETRARLAALVEAARLLRAGGVALMATRLVVTVEPRGSPLHPGPGWCRTRLGPGVDAGWGVRGVIAGRAAVPLAPAPTILRRLAGAPDAWSHALGEVDRLGAGLVERLTRDRAERRPVVLRPSGAADVADLLVSPRLRHWLAGWDGTGLGTVAVPDRSRGWTDVRLIDPVFVAAAWEASPPEARGFRCPLLVTADEVGSPRGVADPSGPSRPDPLADPVREPPVDAWTGDVRGP